MKDIETREDIQTLVDTFYKQVLKDETIGYLFTEVANISFEKHMPKMYDFWESILFQKTAYQGNPMSVHFSLNKKSPLKSEHFARWKELWFSTLENLFDGPVATEAKNRANTIAYLMESKMPKTP